MTYKKLLLYVIASTFAGAASRSLLYPIDIVRAAFEPIVLFLFIGFLPFWLTQRALYVFFKNNRNINKLLEFSSKGGYLYMPIYLISGFIMSDAYRTLRNHNSGSEFDGVAVAALLIFTFWVPPVISIILFSYKHHKFNKI